MKIRKVNIDSYKIFRDFEMELSHNKETLDFVVLAGVNGSGKTSVLEFIYDELQNKPSRNTRKGTLTVDDNGNYLDTDSFGTYIGQNWVDKIKYFPSGLLTVSDAKKVIQEFIDKLIYELNHSSQEAYKTTQEFLMGIFEGFDLQISFSGLDRKREVFFETKFSKEIPDFESVPRFGIDDLSSGEKELITKTFTLYLSDIKDSVILIDEPEFSLHPNWQSRIVKIYRDFAERNNNQIILATHSPQIIGATPKESLRILAKEDGKVVVYDQFEGAYGWKVEKILLEIMGVEALRPIEVENKLFEARQMVFSNQHETEDFRSLMDELEAILGYTDPDLVLIRLETAKRRLEA